MIEKLQKLIERFDNAEGSLTRGPWTIEDEPQGPDYQAVGTFAGKVANRVLAPYRVSPGPTDAEGVVEARNAIPDLLVALRAAVEELDQAHRDVEFFVAHLGAESAGGTPAAALVRLAYGGRPPAASEHPSTPNELAACKRVISRLPHLRMSPDVLEAVVKFETGMTATEVVAKYRRK